MSENNPILENVDDAIDAIEKFVEAKLKAAPKATALWLMAQLRGFLGVPDNYAGDQD